MYGSIAGDIIGSIYEWDNIKTKNFPLFSNKCFYTDDSVLTLATAETLLGSGNYAENYRKYFNKYRGRGYGDSFQRWAISDSEIGYNSWGNGAAMRVAPIGFAFNSLDETLNEADKCARCTHNHPEGIKGAQAVATTIFLIRQNKSKEDIRKFITQKFYYNLNFTIDSIRDDYSFNDSSQGSCPQAIVSYLDSSDFEDAIRNAISIGGDSDTIACITGGIAEAAYGVPEDIKIKVRDYLDQDLIKILDEFYGHIIKRFL